MMNFYCVAIGSSASPERTGLLNYASKKSLFHPQPQATTDVDITAKLVEYLKAKADKI